MSCGSCNACCTVLGVEEIAKRPGTRCSHLCDRGCGVYESRPASCREFECVWLQMASGPTPLPKRLRPDRSGVLLVPSPEDGTVAAHCMRDGALEEKAMKRHVDRWLANGVSIIRIAGNKRTLIRLVPQ